MKNILIKTILGLTLPLISSVSIASEYSGSSFNEVYRILGNNDHPLRSTTEVSEHEVYIRNQLPIYPVTLASLSSGRTDLVQDGKRTVNERFDYYDYLPKKLHPNGVCVVGTWNVDQESPYSGYFKKGSQGLFIGRVSVTMDYTQYNQKRGFGLAGKVFPTMDPNQRVVTGNFTLADILLGKANSYYLKSQLTNEPESGFDLSLMALALKIVNSLKKADVNPTYRPLTQVARLGEESNLNSPQWMRVTLDASTKVNSQSDFRREVLQAMKDNGELVLNVEVNTPKSANQKPVFLPIGQIRVNQAIVGYGCDRRLHFPHSKMKE